MIIKEVLDEACWTGYKQVGTKKKGKRRVPNCVPVSESLLIEQVDYCAHCGNIMLPEGYGGGLRKWFKEKWVNIGKKEGGKHPECGTSGSKSGYAKCVPAAKARSMSAAEKRSATTRKRRAQGAAGRSGKDTGGSGKTPIYVSTDKKK